jgi:hypothetical protein
MRKICWALFGAISLTGCGEPKDAQVAADSAARDIQLTTPDSILTINDAALTAAPQVDTVYVERSAQTRPPAASRKPTATQPAPAPAAAPAPEPAPPPPPLPPARLEVGTVIEASAGKALTSRTNKAGETFTAKIGSAVTAEDGRVVIPAGAEVTLTIVTLKPATNTSAKDGTIELRATGIVVNGESRPIDATVTYVEHTLKGRGVTGSEAAKVGAGTAAGAILGKVIGGGTGAAVGAVTGAAAGTAIAVKSADRDVVVAVGAKIKLALRSALDAGS